jgi:ATP-dependent protease HslVU (ClpYQ) peptidase subunit
MVWDEARGSWYPSVKVRRTKLGLVGAAGDGGDCVRMMDWAEENFNQKKKPKFETGAGEEDDCVLLLVNAEGIHIMTQSDPYPEKVAEGTYAIGSGGKAAWGALLAGLPLERAMEIAGHVDPYTRGPFDIIMLDEKK